MKTIKLRTAVDRLRFVIESTEKRIEASVQWPGEPIEYPHGDRYRVPSLLRDDSDAMRHDDRKEELFIRGNRIMRYRQARVCVNRDLYESLYLSAVLSAFDSLSEETNGSFGSGRWLEI